MKLSIIIPFYNSEKYIEACLKSCLEQDFDDYEIICVDDGSTDLSYHICEQYAQNNSRIRVIKKENGGVSSARNKGIVEAEGEWIWFVDSDDMVLRNCISYLYSCVAIGGEYDLLMFDSKRVNDPIEEQWNTLSPDVISLDGIELFTKFPKYSYGNSPFSYWFKRNIIAEQRIKFDDSMKYAEDTKFIFEYKMSCKKGVMLDSVCYYYIQRENSAMHNVQCSEHLYCMRQLVELYHSTSQKITDESLRSLIEGKRTAALKALQFDLLFNIKNYNLTKKVIEEFKTMGIYPYENGRISGNKNWRQFLINTIYRLFRHEHLYLLMCKLLSKEGQG